MVCVESDPIHYMHRKCSGTGHNTMPFHEIIMFETYIQGYICVSVINIALLHVHVYDLHTCRLVFGSNICIKSMNYYL